MNKYLVALTSVAPWKNHFGLKEFFHGATLVNATRYLSRFQKQMKQVKAAICKNGKSCPQKAKTNVCCIEQMLQCGKIPSTK